MNHVVRQWGGEIPTLSVPLPFPYPHSGTGSLTATDKSVTLVSQLSQSSGEWAWWGFRQWRNFSAFYMRLLPPLLFRAVPLFEWGEMLCSAVFVSVVRQMKALCVHGFATSSARKGKGASLFDIFFPHAPLAGRYTRKIKDNSSPSFFFGSSCFFFFQRTVSIWELSLFLRPFDLLLHRRTILQRDNNAVCSLPQSSATSELIYAIHMVCMIKACSSECLSLASLLPLCSIL